MSDQPTAPNTAPKKFVFVLMPFDRRFEDVYQVGIKAACRDAGAYCERVDEQIFQESILEQVYNQIAKADLIVADMTGRNPNVFYEVGYCHALNKKVILLTQDADDIPFDLHHYTHIIYEGSIVQLKNELERRVTWYLAQPKSETFDLLSNLDFFIEGQQIIDGAKIRILNVKRPNDRMADGISMEDAYKTSHRFDLLLHNRSDNLIRFDRLRIVFAQDSHDICTIRISGRSESHLPDGGFISWMDVPSGILPSAWERFECTARIDFSELEEGQIYSPITSPLRFQAIVPFAKKEIEVFLEL